MDDHAPPEVMPPPVMSLPQSDQRLSLTTATETPLPPSAINSPQRNPPDTSVQQEATSPLEPNMAPNRRISASSLQNGDPGMPHKNPPSRRASSNLHVAVGQQSASPTAATGQSPLHSTIEQENEPLTPAAVAQNYFSRELQRHQSYLSPVAVFLHDSCYGHRFSRPRTSKTHLSLIVERPERILASVLGVAAAYVRLGEAHIGGSNPPHPEKNSEQLPFTIHKTNRHVGLGSNIVTAIHGTKWMEELKSMCDSAGPNLASTGKELKRTPAPAGKPEKTQLHEGDLYLCPESLQALQGALGGVLDAVDTIFQASKAGPSRAFVCIRPPGHHCSADLPSGFCWLNNVHVGIEHAAQTHGLTHAAIIDFDLHHGDGSQSITWERNDRVGRMPKNTPNWKKTSIGYFSLHDINSYPCEYGDVEKVQMASLCLENAHGQSIWNVHLQEWKTEAEFWNLYETRYRVLIDKARAYLKAHVMRLQTSPNQPRPKAAIFISAGFDASEWESQGMQRHKVNVPTEFYARFTRDIVALANEEGTGVDGRVISVLEGGYSDRALTSGVLSHISGLCAGQGSEETNSTVPDTGLGADMARKMAGLSLEQENAASSIQSTQSYNPDWWHSSRLSELESLVSPPPPPAKKTKASGASSYASPTQSFSAKVVDPAKIHRTASGTLKQSPTGSSRPSTPPPPDVEWSVATHELSKLLIPSDRQTRSCKPEELAAPSAAKVRKERQSLTKALPTDPVPSGRQLRGRKPKNYADPSSETEPLRTTSRTTRRQTIADLPSAEPENKTNEADARPPSRRLSAASNISSSTNLTASNASSQARLSVPRSNSSSSLPTSNGVQVKKRTTTRTEVPSATRQADPRPALVKKEDSNVDQLTSGLKRITFKVPPRDEYEARLKQEEDKKKKPTKTSTTKRAATGARTSKTIAPKPSTLPTVSSTQSSIIPDAEPAAPAQPTSAPELVSDQPPAVPPQIIESNQPQSAPKQPPTHISMPPPPLPVTVNQSQPNSTVVGPPFPQNTYAQPSFAPVTPTEREFIPFIGAGPPQMSTQMPSAQLHHDVNPHMQIPPQSQQQAPSAPLQWLPPNSDAALPANVRPPPAFSSVPTSPISAPLTSRPSSRPGSATGYVTTMPRPTSAGRTVEELPHFSATGVIPFANLGKPGSVEVNQMAHNLTTDHPSRPVDESLSTQEAKSDFSIWDVPDTPRK